MKLKIRSSFLALVSLISFSTLSNQSSYIAPLAKESLLMDVAVNGEQLLAVGERGHLLVSSDNGANWQQKSIPTTSALTAVYAIDDHIWAVGHDAIIIASKDGGGSWAVQQYLPDLERPLMDVLFFDKNNGIAIGAYGVFFRTTDSGKTWTREYHTAFLHPDDQEYLEELKQEDEAFYQEEMASILPHLNRVNLNSDRLFIAGETGLLAFSNDNGVTWSRLESGYYGSFFDVLGLDDGSVVAAGLRGNVYKSDVTREVWSRIDSGTTATFNSILPLSQQEYLFLGNNGTMFLYSDNNQSVTQTDDGKNLINAVLKDGKVTAVSAVGIKTIELE